VGERKKVEAREEERKRKEEAGEEEEEDDLEEIDAGEKAKSEDVFEISQAKDATLMSRDQFMRQTNEMARTLKNWDWHDVPERGVSHYEFAFHD
jgi:DNA-binding transcriptional regulator YiaG